jgi:glyoxylase-like metal-dependent hydrolase (beta-lactamase superfamily II)
MRQKPSMNLIERAIEQFGMNPATFKYLILTHDHQDHTQNLRLFQRHFPTIKTICHEKDAPTIRLPFQLSQAWGEGFRYYGMNPLTLYFYKWIYGIFGNIYYRTLLFPNHIDYVINQTTRLQLHKEWIDLLPVPGHSNGHLMIRDCRKNLFVSDFVPFTPWIEPTRDSIEQMMDSCRYILRFNSNEVTRTIRAHGDMRKPNSNTWEVNPWSEEKPKYQFFLDTIHDTLERIPTLLKRENMNVEQLTAHIIPHYKSYSQLMAKLFMPPAISWGIAYGLHLEKTGKIQRCFKKGKITWTA